MSYNIDHLSRSFDSGEIYHLIHTHTIDTPNLKTERMTKSIFVLRCAETVKMNYNRPTYKYTWDLHVS